MRKAAHVRIKLDGLGKGEIVVNGVHMGDVVSGMRLFSSVEKGTVLQLDIVTDNIEVAAQDVQTIVSMLTPEDRLLQHQPIWSGRFEICSVCRQVVGNPRWNPLVCPGPMASKS